jgi:hypothetical protein
MALGQLAPWLNINTQEWGNLAARGAQLDIERQRLAEEVQERKAEDSLRRDQLQFNRQDAQTQNQQAAAALALRQAALKQGGLLGQEKIDQSGQTAAARLGLTADKNANTAAFQQGTLQNNQDRNQILALAQAWKQQQSEKENKWSDTDSKDAKSLDQQILGYFRAYSSATPANQKVLQDKISDLMGQRKAISSNYQTAASTLTAGTPNPTPAPAPAPTEPAAAALTGGQSAAPGAKPKAPKDKVAMANAVALIHPKWTKKDVIDYVNAQ